MKVKSLVPIKLIDGFQFYEIIAALSKPKTETTIYGCQHS